MHPASPTCKVDNSFRQRRGSYEKKGPWRGRRIGYYAPTLDARLAHLERKLEAEAWHGRRDGDTLLGARRDVPRVVGRGRAARFGGAAETRLVEAASAASEVATAASRLGGNPFADGWVRVR